MCGKCVEGKKDHEQIEWKRYNEIYATSNATVSGPSTLCQAMSVDILRDSPA